MAWSDRYTPEQNKLLDWAIDTICEKYLAAGGDKDQMMSWDMIDAFFCGLLYREGEQGVRNFVENYSYTPTVTRGRGYA